MQQPSLDSLRNRLLARHRTRLARRGNFGPEIAALHATADLIDAYHRRWDRLDYQNGKRPRPHASLAGLPLEHLAMLASLGLTAWDEWPAMWQQRKQRDGRMAARAWLTERERVCAVLSGLLCPHGQNSPRLTADDVRAMADRMAVEVMPIPGDNALAA